MKSLPADRAEVGFCDYKPPYTPAQAEIEAHRCLYCVDAPCIAACPTAIDIPTFIQKIATGNVRGSARTIFDANILGMSCARVCPVEVLCVGDCVYNEMGVPPIQIGKLQRYATDAAFASGWRFFDAGADLPWSVGLIGAGPASLAAAHELRRHGHQVILYDKREHAGGLNATGVAPYKMQADRALEEVEWILGIGGIDVRYGVTIGVDTTWAELESRHDALFIGVGLGADRGLGVPGEELAGVHGAVAFIERMKTGAIDLAGVEHALVIGGGNTAMDSMRGLLGLGVPSVTLVYRGTEQSMSGYAHEWAAAKQLGARVVWQSLPVAFEGDAGHVTGARYARLDDSKQPIAGTEQTLPADLVLIAIGQARLSDLVAGLDGVVVAGGRIVVDNNGRTGRTRVYAGGDCANGGKEVVNAAAEGKAAALAIHADLTATAVSGDSHA